MIGGIVLAAGLSERMGEGRFKQLLPIGGRPMVAVVAANAVASELDEVVVVTGHRGEEVAAAVSATGAFVAHNPDYLSGNMTSFRTGYRALPRCDAYVILLTDMPGVDSAMINRHVALWHEQHPWAAVSAYQDRRAHPLLMSASAMAAAVSATQPRAVWKLLASESSVVDVKFDCPAPADLNTLSDYRELSQ